jgi:hypothetical protein
MYVRARSSITARKCAHCSTAQSHNATPTVSDCLENSTGTASACRCSAIVAFGLSVGGWLVVRIPGQRLLAIVHQLRPDTRTLCLRHCMGPVGLQGAAQSVPLADSDGLVWLHCCIGISSWLLCVCFIACIMTTKPNTTDGRHLSSMHCTILAVP